MKSVLDIANSSYMYLVAIGVILFILMQATVYLIKSYKRGLKIGMDKEKLRKAITSSAIFTIVPSIGIFLGVIALSGALGIPLPWIRLSVIGALHYEVMAADVAAKAANLGALSASTITPDVFVSIAFVMTIGIIWGALFCLFFLKKYSKKLKVTTSNNRWGTILFSAMFIGMVSAFIGQGFADLRKGSYVTICVITSSALAMAGFTYLTEKKNIKWLENFSLSFSMIFGMLVAIILG